MKAILTAAINDDVLRYQTSSEMSDRAGAGLVNAYNAYCVLRDGNYKVKSFPAMDEARTIKTYSFSVASTEDTVRVSLAWLKHLEIDGATLGPLAELMLVVCDPTGSVVTSARDSEGNLLITEFQPMMTGEYLIKVVLCVPSAQKCNFAIAWSAIE